MAAPIETYIPYILTFVFGSIIGSFLNVCVYRMPRGLSVVAPRSACPSCGARLGAAELIPIASYILLRGKCSHCRSRIPPRYPLIEFLCGALWAALLYRFGKAARPSGSLPLEFPPFEFICYAALCSVLLAVFFIDVEWLRIPNALTAASMVPASAALVRYVFLLDPPGRFRSAYASVNPAAPFLGLAPCAFFIAVYLITAVFSKGGGAAIGMGDIKLLIPVGLALGLWQCLFAIFAAVTLGGVAGIVLIASGVKKRKDPIPFGPFIVAGFIAALFIRINT